MAALVEFVRARSVALLRPYRWYEVDVRACK